MLSGMARRESIGGGGGGAADSVVHCGGAPEERERGEIGAKEHTNSE